jgi:cytochrome c-550 PedF
MNKLAKLACCLLATTTLSFGHGDVTPQPMNTKGLPHVADDVIVNPLRGNAEAIEIGKSGYNSNCARCHGLGAISGGVAPDLRYLEAGDDDTDEYMIGKVLEGAVRNGNVYMPPFKGVLSNEAIWAIRSWIETVPVD